MAETMMVTGFPMRELVWLFVTLFQIIAFAVIDPVYNITDFSVDDYPVYT